MDMKILILLVVCIVFGNQKYFSSEAGTVKRISFIANSLSNNLLGTDPNREFIIYLPPGYFNTGQDYPVIYFLPGFTCPIDEFMDGTYDGFKLEGAMNKLIGENKLTEMIVVIPDGGNRFGGAFYVNSSVAGNWEDYITKDLVNYVDENFRTIRSPEGRAITGHSMGGFGSIHIGFHHPDIFGYVYSISPGIFALDGLEKQGMFTDEKFNREILTKAASLPQSAVDEFKHEWFNFIGSPYKAKNWSEYKRGFFFAYASAFAPNNARPPLYIDLPLAFKKDSIKEISTVMDIYRSGFGHWTSKIIDNKSKILHLHSIVIESGSDDSWITEGTRYLHEILKNQKIRHIFNEFEGGHDDKLQDRLVNHMLPHFSNLFSGLSQNSKGK